MAEGLHDSFGDESFRAVLDAAGRPSDDAEAEADVRSEVIDVFAVVRRPRAPSSTRAADPAVTVVGVVPVALAVVIGAGIGALRRPLGAHLATPR